MNCVHRTEDDGVDGRKGHRKTVQSEREFSRVGAVSALAVLSVEAETEKEQRLRISCSEDGTEREN